jgi:hypothetical protein
MFLQPLDRYTDLSLRLDVSSGFTISRLVSVQLPLQLTSSDYIITTLRLLFFVRPLVSSPELLQLPPIQFGILKFNDQHSFRSVSI